MDDNVSVILPVQAHDIGMAQPYARLAAETRSRRLWSGQSLGVETHAAFAALSAQGLDLAYGSSVTLMPMRHPFTAALNARSIAVLSGRTYIAGIGPGAKSLQRGLLGAAYDSPLAATEEYVRVMRSFLKDEVATSPGELWPVSGMALPVLDAPPVEIGVGVLRSGMARVAGQVADWAITWLTPVEYVEQDLLPTMTSSARAAGREAPRVASVLHCVLDQPGRDRIAVAQMSSERHLSAPHYLDMLERAGITFGSTDLRERASTMLDRGVIATGTPFDIADEIRRYHKSGVSEVVLNLGGVYLTEGPGAAARDLALILDTYGDA